MSRNDYGLRFGETKQYYGNVPDGRQAMKRGGDVMPKRNKKNFRPTKAGAGMTRAGVAAYRRANPGSKAAKDPNSRLRQARRRWKC